MTLAEMKMQIASEDWAETEEKMRIAAECSRLKVCAEEFSCFEKHQALPALWEEDQVGEYPIVVFVGEG